MGTTAEKGARVLQSIAEVQEGINNLGGSLTDQTPFKDFKTELDNIYDTLPKTSFQEGTEVTIEGGLKGKIDFDDGKVGFGQASQESTNGYQLYPIKNIAETTENGITYSIKDGVMSINGTATSSFSISIVGSYGTSGMSLTAGSYTWGYYNVSGSYTGVFGKYLRPTGTGTAIWDGSLVDYLSTKTLEQDYNSLYSVLYIGTGASFNNLKFKLMICKGTYTAQTIPNWEPYTGGYASPSPNWEQPIQCVTGNQNVTVTANILDYSTLYLHPNNNLRVINNDHELEVTPNTAILIKANAGYNYGYFELDANKNTLVDSGWKYGTTTFTSNANTKYIRLNLRYADNSTITNVQDFINGMGLEIQYGTEYVTPRTYQFSLGNNKFYKIGDYADELLYDVDEDKVYKLARLGIMQLDETLNWEGGEVVTGIYRYQITVADAINIAQRQNVLTEYTHFTLTGEVGTGFIYSKIFYFYPDTDCTNVLLFKAWIANHHTPLIYPLAEEQLQELTDTTLKQQVKNWYYSQSFNGTTILESNGDLPMIIKVRALKGE